MAWLALCELGGGTSWGVIFLRSVRCVLARALRSQTSRWVYTAVAQSAKEEVLE